MRHHPLFRQAAGFIIALCITLGTTLAYSSVSRAASSIFEDNLLDSIHYRPSKGTWYFSASIQPILHQDSTTYPNGTATYDDAATGFTTTYVLEYGLTDWLYVYLSQEAGSSNTTQTHLTTGGQTFFPYSGAYDPVLELSARYLGGLKGTFFGDAFVALVPGLGPKWVATVTQSGNNFAGNTELQAGTNLRWVFGPQELGTTLSVAYRSQTQFVDPTTGFGNGTEDSRVDPDLTVNYRLHATTSLYLQVGAELIGGYSGNFNYPNETPAQARTTAYPWYVAPHATLGYLAASNVLLSATYTHSTYTSTVTPTLGSTQAPYSSVFSQDLLAFGVGLTF